MRYDVPSRAAEIHGVVQAATAWSLQVDGDWWLLTGKLSGQLARVGDHVRLIVRGPWITELTLEEGSRRA